MLALLLGIITFLGLLWVKRVTSGKLRCNIFSAAVAAALFVGIILGGSYFIFVVVYRPGSSALAISSFLFLAFGLVPLTSAITLLLGKRLIPFFKIRTDDILSCAGYLTAWTFVALTLVSILKALGFLFLCLLLGGGMPRPITRVSNDQYYYH